MCFGCFKNMKPFLVVVLLSVLWIGVVGQSWLDIEEPDLFLVQEMLNGVASSSVAGNAQETAGTTGTGWSGGGGTAASGACFRAACQKRGSSCASSHDVCVVPYTCSGVQQCSPTKGLGAECAGDQECNSNDFVISGRYCFQGECTVCDSYIVVTQKEMLTLVENK